MSPRDQFRASHAIGVLRRLLDEGNHYLWSHDRDAIETLIEITETAAEAEAAPASTSANGPSKSGAGAAYREI
jgi:hypothetical protein